MTDASHGVSGPVGELTTLDGEEYYRISGYHRMAPFLMTLASDSDLWMFITSAGGLTAGRVDPEGSLFPYETVDKLQDGHHHTGPTTLVRVRRSGQPDHLWQPFSDRPERNSWVERNLYKNTLGNRVVFEEIRHDLDLAFRSRWSGCDDLGLVRTATLTNRGSTAVDVSVLDGLRNVLPYGIPLALQQQSSCLADAYKRTDLDRDTQLGIFSLTAKIVDRAEAAEELRANTVWTHGLARCDVALALDAVSAFRRGDRVTAERVLTGRRGNYLVVSSLALEARAHAKWHLVADVGRSHAQIAALRALVREEGDLDRRIEDGLARASENLIRNVASADGLQSTGHPEVGVHHFANVLFNNMRGGVFAENERLPAADLVDFLRTRNRPVAARHEDLLANLPAEISKPELLAAAARTGDPDLQRLGYEYLPLWFGRRHGDPSRPWNRFAIRVKNEDGSRALRYEGNWRDIFQNWEALALSFPGFLTSFVAKFVNASTVDGFNPYRVTRDGVEWETASPDDPWSYIGYWGDHQIIYLLKFLEALPHFFPEALETLLEEEIFSYADVPYRIVPYEKIVENPQATIDYDEALAARIADRVREIGTDGKLLFGPEGSVHHVNLLEKLLVPALAKLSNLVPDGGIWMNTQRPEWNDANNALVGNGLSMVTLCYLRRYLRFLQRLLDGREDATPSISTEVVEWFRRIHSTLDSRRSLFDAAELPGRERRRLLDELGRAFSDYRTKVYANGFSGRSELAGAEITDLCRTALVVIDHAIRANRRGDGLYHSYNLLEIAPERTEISVRPLYEMLEGQVAALASGVVDAEEAVRLVSSLCESRLFREDQRSFLLYPARELPAFLERNVIPEESIGTVPLLRELLAADERSVLQRDAQGVGRFDGGFTNARDLAAALDRLAADERWTESIERDRETALAVFEDVFHHRSFTGRSGTMYGYEGLGCIYWHMVAKLLLAVQEIFFRAVREGQPPAVAEALARAYYRIRAGLGFEKTVAEYGAFPTDPYSHTPAHGGAQQPGMTGQVKEEILTRFGELGVRVEDGVVGFSPVLLRPSEFRRDPARVRFYDLGGEVRSLEVPAGALAFSVCQVPIVYELDGQEAWIRVTSGRGEPSTHPGCWLDADQSRALFGRTGGISRIDVGVPEQSLGRF